MGYPLNIKLRIAALAKKFIVDDIAKGDKVVLSKLYKQHGGIDLPPGTVGIVTSVSRSNPDLITVEARRPGQKLPTRNQWNKIFWLRTF